MRKVREAVAKELTPTLKRPGRPPKEEAEEEDQPVAQQVDYGTTNTEYIRSRLKDKHPALFAQVVNEEITARGERAAVGGDRPSESDSTFDPATVAGSNSEKTTRELAKGMGMSERTYRLRRCALQARGGLTGPLTFILH